MNLRERNRTRVLGLMALILAVSLVCGAVRAYADGAVVTGTVCLLAVAGLYFVGYRSADDPCPYCRERSLPLRQDALDAVCGYCGSYCERLGKHQWQALSTPADDRVWVIKFLPKLRRLRRELSPLVARKAKADVTYEL